MASLTCTGALARDNRNRKRRRGGQEGNKNAVKHGFYTGIPTPVEIGEIWNTVNTEGLEPELALLRLKLFTSLKRDPGNLRVIREASKLLTRWYASKFQLDKTECLAIKKLITGILRGYLGLPSSPAEKLSKQVVFLQNETGTKQENI